MMKRAMNTNENIGDINMISNKNKIDTTETTYNHKKTIKKSENHKTINNARYIVDRELLMRS